MLDNPCLTLPTSESWTTNFSGLYCSRTVNYSLPPNKSATHTFAFGFSSNVTGVLLNGSSIGCYSDGCSDSLCESTKKSIANARGYANWHYISYSGTWGSGANICGGGWGAVGSGYFYTCSKGVFSSSTQTCNGSETEIKLFSSF